MTQEIFNLDMEKISESFKKEISDRKKNLELFLETGLPNKKDENWKFTDLKSIIDKNFKNITNNQDFNFNKEIELIKDFDHNYILLVNGLFKLCDSTI